ncbi:hypothetical protein DRI50_05930 [candidate division KSB1 bacterium]|jgi:heme exporter protein A|nr:MAG: hypothetical protein DRI50_05930 [candidate division KSB1 bacterium]
MKLLAKNIVKRFGNHIVLRNISFEISNGKSLAIIGSNGSGKTTLIKILANLIAPTRGSVIYQQNGQTIPREHINAHIGLVGPYLQLYQELTARENLYFFARMRNIPDYQKRIAGLMETLGLKGREDDTVKAYSSGMQQRLKYVAALLHQPDVLLVDEPRSNLDEKGIETVYRLLQEQKERSILIIATNDSEDLQLADQTLKVEQA